MAPWEATWSSLSPNHVLISVASMEPHHLPSCFAVRLGFANVGQIGHLCCIAPYPHFQAIVRAGPLNL